MIKKVFLDMDGVLTNFHKGVCKTFDYPYILDEMIRYDFWEDWKEKKVTRRDVNDICNQLFWEDLEWMHDGKEILKIVEEAYGKENIFIFTQPMPNVGSWTGKRIWIEHMAPDYKKQLIVTQASRAFFASPDTLLIDDKQENVDEFIKAGGNAILIPRPWNRLLRHKVIPHLEKEIKHYATRDFRTEATFSEAEIRTFTSGATRDTAEGKPSYIKALSPIVLQGYVEYIGRHRTQSDGSVRDWDNWKQGIPQDVYLDGLGRHEMAVWLLCHGFPASDNHGPVTLKDSLYGIIFNAQGMLHEILKKEIECLENAPQA